MSEKRSFVEVRYEARAVVQQIRDLEAKKSELLKELQEVCNHPRSERYTTSGESEKCLKCDKIIRSWPVRIGNPI